MTNYSRSVLKSNGLCHSKNFPVKFGFSSKTVPANIVKKLSAHSLLKSVFFRISTSLTNAPRSLSRAKVGTPSAFGERSHTAAYTAKHGAFRMGALLLPSERSTRFGNPAWPGFKTANFAAFGSWPGVRSRRTQRACGAAMRLCASLLRGVAAPLGCVTCLQLGDVAVFSLCAQYFLNVRGGVVSLPSERFTRFGNPAWPWLKIANFAVFCGRAAIIDSSGVKFDPTHNLENFKIILISSITCGMVAY